MAFGKAVFAEPLDLLEAALGEIRGRSRCATMPSIILLAEVADRAGALEGRHGAAQLVGLARREAAGDDGDLHRLLLEQRHAERLAEDRLAAPGFGILGLLLPLPAPQIGMHHVALDRAGPHDRHLDDEIVEFARPQPRQHRHLRAAFDLEDAERVGAADHVVDAGRPLAGSSPASAASVPVARVVMLCQQIEGAAQAGQHAERQDVDLEDLRPRRDRPCPIRPSCARPSPS